MKLLPGQPLRPADYRDIERQLTALFAEIIYRPLGVLLEQVSPHAKVVADFGSSEIRNATGDEALREALARGTIQYAAGVFSGTFDIATSRAIRAMGGKLGRATHTYQVNQSIVPGWVKAQAAVYRLAAEQAHKAALAKLSDIESKLDALVDQNPVDAEHTVSKVDSGFRVTAKNFEVMPELGTAARDQLARAYSDNMKLWIKKFSRDQIQELREVVERNAEQGYRFAALVSGIKGRYGVAQSKAEFLARQETGLFMSQYRRQRFTEIGLTRYVWQTSGDQRVRPAPGLDAIERLHSGNHRILNGKTFFYKLKAPAVYMSSHQPCNPGEDYNCRCVDRPVIEPASVTA